jgi:hypothetical protein
MTDVIVLPVSPELLKDQETLRDYIERMTADSVEETES